MIWKEYCFARVPCASKPFYKKLLKWICDEQEDLVACLKQQYEALYQAASFIVAYRATA